MQQRHEASPGSAHLKPNEMGPLLTSMPSDELKRSSTLLGSEGGAIGEDNASLQHSRK